MRFVEMTLPRGRVAGHQKADASKLVVGEVAEIVDDGDLSSVVEGEEVECGGQADECSEDETDGAGGQQSLQGAEVSGGGSGWVSLAMLDVVVDHSAGGEAVEEGHKRLNEAELLMLQQRQAYHRT
jgi:hypothetical protein